MMQKHGGASQQEVLSEGLNAYDFSANINPWGCSPAVSVALSHVKPQYYPDPECARLRVAIAEHEGVAPYEVLCGNGATELIWAVCRWASHESRPHGASVAVAEPAFSQYRQAAERCGLTVHRYQAFCHTGFAIDTDEYLRFVAKHRPALTFLCSPNNPTGQVFEESAIRRLSEVCPPGILIVDQAYREYARPIRIEHSDRLLRLCSLTKAYGLAGFRIGYLVGPEQLLSSIGAQLPSWNVNAVAQAAAIAALGDQNWLQETLRLRRRAEDYLRLTLTESGFEITSHGAGFFLIHVGDAGRWREMLRAGGFAVRDCASFGLPDYLRISAGPEDACRKLVTAMNEVRRDIGC